MYGSMVDIQSPTAEIGRGKKIQRNHMTKYNCLPYSIGRRRIIKSTAQKQIAVYAGYARRATKYESFRDWPTVERPCSLCNVGLICW